MDRYARMCDSKIAPRSLFPYSGCSRCNSKYTWWERNIRGGIPSIIWPYTILTVVIVVAWNILWITEVLPPSISPINDFWIRNITFLISFLLITRFNDGNNKYKQTRQLWMKSMNSMYTVSNIITSSIVSKDFEKIKSDPNIHVHISNIMHYIRATMYATEDYLQGNFDADNLPLPEELHAQLQYLHPETGSALENLCNLILHEISELNSKSPLVTFGKALDNVRIFMTGIQDIQQLILIRSPPAFRVHTIVILCTYFVFLFQYLFDIYGWYGIAVGVFLVYAMIGLLLASFQVRNAFEKPTKNYFLYEVDVCGNVDRIASESDKLFFNLYRKMSIDLDAVSGHLFTSGTIAQNPRFEMSKNAAAVQSPLHTLRTHHHHT